MIQDPRQAPQYQQSAPPPGPQSAPQGIPPGWPKRGQRYGHPVPVPVPVPGPGLAPAPDRAGTPSSVGTHGAQLAPGGPGNAAL